MQGFARVFWGVSFITVASLVTSIGIAVRDRIVQTQNPPQPAKIIVPAE